MSAPMTFLDGRVTLHPGDCRDVLKTLPDCSIDSVVTDPPYALVSIGKRFGKPGAKPARDGDVYARASAGFMGQQWDTGETAFAPEFWAEVLRVLKPGGHVASFSGTRTYHRMACAIEDAGFEIRDQLAWAYGSGFPKSHDVAKAIDKAAGVSGSVCPEGKPVKRMIPGADQAKNGWEKNSGRDYQPGRYVPGTDSAVHWQGWGTGLKPAWEPICLARKPLIGTVAETVLAHGTGALNIDGCRVALSEGDDPRLGGRGAWTTSKPQSGDTVSLPRGSVSSSVLGRFPANLLHDGSDEVLACFPNGSARFFYTAKADAQDRLGTKHPTVKPVNLMQWACRLITPPGGVVLDPFAGTGTTGEAAFREGFSAVLVEREAAYQADIARRMSLALSGAISRKVAAAAARAPDADDLFAAWEVQG